MRFSIRGSGTERTDARRDGAAVESDGATVKTDGAATEDAGASIRAGTLSEPPEVEILAEGESIARAGVDARSREADPGTGKPRSRTDAKVP